MPCNNSYCADGCSTLYGDHCTWILLLYSQNLRHTMNCIRIYVRPWTISRSILTISYWCRGKYSSCKDQVYMVTWLRYAFSCPLCRCNGHRIRKMQWDTSRDWVERNFYKVLIVPRHNAWAPSSGTAEKEFTQAAIWVLLTEFCHVNHSSHGIPHQDWCPEILLSIEARERLSKHFKINYKIPESTIGMLLYPGWVWEML